MQLRDSKALLVCTAALAFTGIVYEFALAQSLSVLLGNSAVQYSLTIGIYLAAMGAGAYRAGLRPQPERQLVRLQIWLALGGPTLFLALWAAAPQLPRTILWIASGSLVAAVGGFTGAELPLLMKLAGRGRLRVLASDYFGMLAACVAFPLMLLPHLGIFGSFFLAALLNSLVAQAFLGRSQPPRPLRLFVRALPAALAVLLAGEATIREWLSDRHIDL